MKANKILKNWVPITAVIALLISTFPVLSSFLQQEDKAITAENRRVEKKIPKGELTGYYVDLVYTLQAFTEPHAGLPEHRYKAFMPYQNLYVVTSGFPTTNYIEKNYMVYQGWQLAEIFNIRKVATVRAAEKEDTTEIKKPVSRDSLETH